MAEKILNTPKKSRGRPKTAFVSKKPKVKQSGPGRPKKMQETTTVSEIKPQFVSKRLTADDSKKKDAFILSMFIVSLIIFGASLFFSQNNAENRPEETKQEIQNTIDTGAIETIAIDNTGSIDNTGEQRSISVANILLSSFYESINNGTISQIYPNINPALKVSKLFKVYFSKTRTQRFVRNLNSDGIQISNIQSDEKESPTLKYTVSYTLQDGKSFEETREMQITNKEIPQVTKMMCINTGCSTFPFFNPGKYNIH